MEAELKSEEALGLGQQLIPHTYLTAFNLVVFGSLYRDNQAEAQYLKACAVYSALCPFSLSICCCLNRLSKIYINTMRYDLAGKNLQQSYSILSTRFPDSEQFGWCLLYQGYLYEATGHRKEARQKFEAALLVLQKYCPDFTSQWKRDIQALSSN